MQDPHHLAKVMGPQLDVWLELGPYIWTLKRDFVFPPGGEGDSH